MNKALKQSVKYQCRNVTIQKLIAVIVVLKNVVNNCFRRLFIIQEKSIPATSVENLKIVDQSLKL